MSSGHGANQAEIERGGYRWFFGIGLVAIVFAFVLKTIDDKLTYSDREQRLGATLKELRGAQTTLASGVSDTRQTTSFMVQEPQAVTGHSEEASNHSSH